MPTSSATDRRSAIVTGVLLLVGLVTVLVSTRLTEPSLAAGFEDPSTMAGAEKRIMVGVMLQFASALASAGIAISLYPTLRKHSHGLAIAAVGFRMMEAVFYSIAALGTLALMMSSAVHLSDPGYQALILVVRDVANFVFGVLAFCVGATMYYIVLHRARLIPRWLSIWGLGAIVPLAIAALHAFFGDGTHYKNWCSACG